MELLIVDDDKVTRELLQEVFEKEGYEVTTLSSGEDALKQLRKKSYPLVLSDIRMLELDGLGLLSFIQKNKLNSVVTLMTGFGTMDGAIRAIKDGAFDYVSKPFRLEELKAVIARAERHWWELSTPALKKTVVAESHLTSRTLLGKSPQIVEVYKTLARATLSPSHVLICGESGTGKELVAQSIHRNSPRGSAPFVAVNCGALTETLLESELFGHLKGAFTGAHQAKRGLFQEADGGTMFLDEIGDIPLSLQVKLLRVLQEGEIRPVGSAEVIKVDVRIIAATHRDLEKAVAQGTFREDLYYRLKVILIELPPLRDRMEDLTELVNHFIARFSQNIGKNISHVSSEAMRLLENYSWPGNIRELEHAMERAVSLTNSTVLYPEDFSQEIQKTLPGEQSRQVVTLSQSKASLESIERAHIERVLEESQYNQSKAATVLGIDRKTLYRKAKRYGIKIA